MEVYLQDQKVLFKKLTQINYYLGGGILNISSGNLTLNCSFLSSSGFPLASVNDSTCQNSTAGSAGSIILHISTINLAENSSITAEGGYYCGGTIFINLS